MPNLFFLPFHLLFLLLHTIDLQPVARAITRREDRSPLPFPATQVFQIRERWPVRIKIKDPNMGVEGHDAMERPFRRFDRTRKEVIIYPNDRMFHGASSEEMAAKFVW
ncbi:hypothetical protein O181_033034 [Austropuccinia psidii MF-1]|uniref:Uncharacterized protein n=1 Tax=Austropuccinia psidii MF-1 TaxID=1389203 RepID=A0A9Q3CXZ3_9BASI|nr:hypothetical protein [Austropuccinia psidii MF-1]